LLGPTGVGKTEMAKAIAERMFPGSAMTRIDMSELSEPHGVARLLGAPPGYIGHEDGGQLTEAVRKRPYQLILLDEVEKAHRDVLLSLLPLLDEGRLTDGRGRTVDFTNTVIVMTSNLGVEALVAKRSMGFAQEGGREMREASGEHAQVREQRTRMLHAAQRALAPELWNRIDEPLCFDALGRVELERIARMFVAQAAELAQREHGITLEVDDAAIELLVQAGYEPALGARPMRRAVSRLIEAPLARAVLAGNARRGQQVRLSRLGDEVRLSLSQSAVDAAE
jgi:ATP-dependent Clp protease ATP-binding subunit ClpC